MSVTIQRAVVMTALMGARFNFSNEAELQEGIARRLTYQELAFEREVRLTPRDRIDFMAGSLGIEVKVDGSNSSVLRQLFRYADCPQVEALILITSLARHRAMPDTINGKPLRVLYLPVAFQ